MSANQGNKTEKASPHRLRKIREQGQVPRARDLASAIGLLLAIKLVFSLTPGWLGDFQQLFAMAFLPLDAEGALDNAGTNLLLPVLWLLVQLLLPLVVIPLCILLAMLYPGGWIFVLSLLMPKASRFNPAAHVGRVLSLRQSTEIGKAIIKALILGACLFFIARDTRLQLLALQASPTLGLALLRGGDIVLTAFVQLTGIFLLFGLIDLPLQIFLFLRQQRMSKQELKDEYKQIEGKPEVKQRLRSLQRQMAQRSARRSIPTADVIITNPTHYAVALKYDANRAEAPYIVAKGVDEMAIYIRQLAAEHQVMVVPVPPLARAVYHSTQINQQIPPPLYRAVAQVLSYVLQLKAFQAGSRRQTPKLPDDLSIPPELARPETP